MKEGQGHIEERLKALGVNRQLQKTALKLIPLDSLGLLIYGSRARGDYTPTSDLDLLALVQTPQGSRASSGVSVSCYTLGQMQSARATLFGMHLARDGVILADPSGALDSVLSQMGEPDPSQLMERVRHFSAILDVSESELSHYYSGLMRLGRYLLRTAIYGLALQGGRPCFSVRELAVRFSQPELVDLLASVGQEDATGDVGKYRDLIARLRVAVGVLPSNPYGSLRGIIVAEWESDLPRATLATLAISPHGETFDYAKLPKVLL
jgi:hypothetical protein